MSLWLLTAAAATTVFAANRVTLGGTSGTPGEVVEVSVGLESDVPSEGLQLSLTLPEGTQLEAGSAAAAGRAAQLSASGGVRDGRLNLTLYSLNRAAIAAGSGEVMTFRLALGATPLTAPLEASAVMAGTSGERIDATCDVSTLTIRGAALSLKQREYSLGRVALGEEQSLTVAVTNSGTEPLELSGLDGAPAGWTLDGTATIAPGATGNARLRYVPSQRGLTDAVMRFAGNAGGTVPPLIVHSDGFGRNEMTLSATAVKGGEEATVNVALKNYDAVCGFTLKVELPKGFRYVQGSFAIDGTRGDGHGTTATVAAAKNGATEVTLTAYSLTNKAFADNDGTVASFRVLAASRTGATMKINQAVLPTILDGKVTDVVSAFNGTYLSVSSPSMSVTTKQNLGRTPVTQSEAGSFSVSNRGNESLVITKIDFDDEGMEPAIELPLTITPRKSGQLTFSRTDGARGVIQQRVFVHCNDPETPVVAIDVTMDRYSPNELTLVAEETDQGDPIEVAVCLANNDAVEGIQFDLGFDAALNGTLTATPTERAEGFSVSLSKLAGGKVRVVAYSLGGAAIARGEGPVLTLRLTPDSECEEGVYSLTASNIVLGDASMSNMHSATVNPDTSVTVNYFLLGDLNNDRKISGLDVNHCVNHLLNPGWSTVKPKAADLNGDGTVTGVDLNALVSKIMNNTEQ